MIYLSYFWSTNIICIFSIYPEFIQKKTKSNSSWFAPVAIWIFMLLYDNTLVPNFKEGSASVSNPGFPEPETRFFGYFLLPETRVFFNYQTREFKKAWNCCCIQILVILITLKLQTGACNGQINTFELSTMRPRVVGFVRWPSYVRCWSVYIFVQLTYLDGSWRHFAHNKCLREL